MAGSVKHGGHRYTLRLPALAAGTAADTQDLFVYDGFADGAATVAAYNFPYDLTSEQVIAACFAVGATLTGAATNFATLAFQQFRAGAAVNDIRVAYSAAGVTTTADTVANLAVASGAVVTGAGTGTLTVQTGVALPWTLQQGDVLVLARISSGTGLATPGIGLTFTTKQFGT